MTKLVFAALAAGLIAAPAAALAQNPAYLFDALHEKDYVKSYRQAWEKLMKDVQPEPDWLVTFNRNYDGDFGRARALDRRGQALRAFLRLQTRRLRREKIRCAVRDGREPRSRRARRQGR